MNNVANSLSPLRIPRPPAYSSPTGGALPAINVASAAALQGSPLSPRAPSETGSTLSSLGRSGGGGRKHNFRAVTGVVDDTQDRREFALLQQSVQQQQSRIANWINLQGSSPLTPRNGTPMNSSTSSVRSSNHGGGGDVTPQMYSASERAQAMSLARQKIREEEEQTRLMKTQLLEARVREDQIRQMEEKKRLQLRRLDEERETDAMVLERARQETERRREMSVEGRRRARAVLAEQLTQSEEKKHVESFSKQVEKARDSKWVMENARIESDFNAKQKQARKDASKADAKLWDEQMKTLEVKSPRTHLSPLARLQKQRAEDVAVVQSKQNYDAVLADRKEFEEKVRSAKVDRQLNLIDGATKVTTEAVYGPGGALLPSVTGNKTSPRKKEVTTKPHLIKAVNQMEVAPSYIDRMDENDSARQQAFKHGKEEADHGFNNAVVSTVLATRFNKNNGVKIDVYNPKPVDSSASGFHKMGCDEERRNHERKLATIRLRELQELQAEEKRLREEQAKLQERHEDQARLNAELEEVLGLQHYLVEMEHNNDSADVASSHHSESSSSPQSWLAKRRLYKVAETGGQYKGGAPVGTRKGGHAVYGNQESYHSPLKRL